MRVLHLFSNSKWTGPAEPALNLCVALRRIGVDADFACAPDAGPAVNKIVVTARERGIEPILDFHLRKHRHPLKDFADRRRLRALLTTRGYTLLHCHLTNDHRIAASATRGSDTPVVRSSYEGEGLRAPNDIVRLLNRTAFLIQPSRRALLHDADRYDFPMRRMAVVPGAVDTVRFDPARPLPDVRERLGIPRDAFVVGIIARLQRHRRYEILFDALRALMRKNDHVHAIIIGRGTYEDQVGKAPAAQSGFAGRIHLTGFLDGDDYAGAIAAFDVKVFLVPGSDGTCRAVREAMAMGKPAIVARRGMLPEIVDDGENGLVFDGSQEGLVHALQTLIDAPGQRATLGAEARRKAEAQFALEAQARAVADIYERVLAAQEEKRGPIATGRLKD